MRNFLPQILFEAPGGVAPTAAPAATPAPTTPWYEGKVDGELAGYFASRGWDKDPVAAAVQAAQAHRQAEKFIGVPTGELIRLPKNTADSEAMKVVYQRLGAPADPKDYDFSAIKDADQRTIEIARDTAAKLNLTKDAAPQLAQVLAKVQKDLTEASLADKTATLAAEKKALDDSWGKSKDANMTVVRATAQKLGVTPEQVNALENVVGYKAVMDMFLSIGVKIGEDSFVKNENGAGGVMTREMAQERMSELKRDSAWQKRHMAGDPATKKELAQLAAIIHGV